jgi:hypothetical protein
LFRTTVWTRIFIWSWKTSGPGLHFGTDEGITYISLIDDLLTGQYDQVLRVVAFNPIEG